MMYKITITFKELDTNYKIDLTYIGSFKINFD